MKSGKWVVFIGLAMMIALAVLCWQLGSVENAVLPAETEKLPVSVEIVMDGAEETIQLWEAGHEEYALFLPGYADITQLRFQIMDNTAVWLDGICLENGDFLQGMNLDTRYDLLITQNSQDTRTLGLTIYQASEIPAVHLDVRSGSMDYIHSAKGAEEPGQMRIYLPDGALHYTGSLESMKGRGNSTWTQEKKPYNLELRNSADLLNMGDAKKWVLLANYYDDSHIRNKVVLDAAQYLNLPYTPQCQWVDLFLNGEYAGLYLLSEKNEIHPQRVAIDSVKGNLISIEKADRLWDYGKDQFVTDGGTPIRIHSTTDARLLQETIHTAERAILAEDGYDPVSGSHWSELIDLTSWAKKYLIEEVFGNLDAGSISQYFYWEGNGKIFAGPAWDYDVTMGRTANWQLQSPNMLYSGRPHLWNWEDTPWYYHLYQKPEFQNAVINCYRQSLRPFLKTLLEAGVDRYAQSIAGSARMNQTLWGTEDADLLSGQMQAYMDQRLAFLDAYWLEGKTFHLVQLYMQWHVMACFAVEPGSCIPEQPIPDGYGDVVYTGWHNRADGSRVDFFRPIEADAELYLREIRLGTEEEQVSGGSGLSGKIWLIPVAALLVLMSLLAAVEVFRAGNRKNGKREKTKIFADSRENSR